MWCDCTVTVRVVVSHRRWKGKLHPKLFTAPVWWHLYVVQRICWEAQPCSLSLWRHQEEDTHTDTHTHTHTHVLYTEEFQCIADSCLVCVCTNHVVFLSLICHTCCTVMLPFVCIHSCGPYLFLPTWHTMCAIVCREEEGGGVICVGVLYLCVSSVTMQPHSISVQVVVTSQLFWISVSVLSQLSECLSWIFFFFLLHPFFYRNHCYKSYNHTRK